MATITEDYISFETAKLLQEKGFNEPCYLGYNKNGDYIPTNNRSNSQIIQPDFCFICCPTLQMAMKWLREVHMLHIWIGHNNKKGLPWYYVIHNIKIGMVAKIGGVDCGSYETACETAIKYTLENLI